MHDSDAFPKSRRGDTVQFLTPGTPLERYTHTCYPYACIDYFATVSSFGRTLYGSRVPAAAAPDYNICRVSSARPRRPLSFIFVRARRRCPVPTECGAMRTTRNNVSISIHRTGRKPESKKKKTPPASRSAQVFPGVSAIAKISRVCPRATSNLGTFSATHVFRAFDGLLGRRETGGGGPSMTGCDRKCTVETAARRELFAARFGDPRRARRGRRPKRQ